MNHKVLLLACASCYVVGAFAMPALAIGPTPAWKSRQTVATGVFLPWHLGADNILAYDHHGNPGVAYVQDGSGFMMYARHVPGAGWQSVIADGGNGGAYPSLVFDRYERPMIGYSSANMETARIETFNGIGWASQLVPGDIEFISEGQYSLLGN